MKDKFKPIVNEPKELKEVTMSERLENMQTKTVIMISTGIFAILCTMVGYFYNAERVASEEIQKETRVIAIENKAEMNEMKISIVETRGEQKVIRTIQESMIESLRRIEKQNEK